MVEIERDGAFTGCPDIAAANEPLALPGPPLCKKSVKSADRPAIRRQPSCKPSPGSAVSRALALVEGWNHAVIFSRCCSTHPGLVRFRSAPVPGAAGPR